MQTRCCGFLRQFAALILGLVLVSPSVLNAEELFFPSSKIVYRQYGHSIAKHPSKQTIEGVKDSEHGTYVRHPYYSFVKSDSGKKMLISDSGLRAVLTPISGSQKISEKYKRVIVQYAITFENVVEKVREIKGAVLTINHDTCGKHLCFVVEGTGDLIDLPSGFGPFKSYVVTKPLPNKKNKGQRFGDVFVPKTHAFYLLRGCWDVTKMNMDNFQETGCEDQGDIFSLPGDDSRNFTQQDHEVIVPYGWTYASVATGESSEHSSMLSSSADVMNSVQKTTGFNVSGNVSGGVPGIFSVSSEFSVTQNKGVTDKIQKMYGTENTYSEHKVIETQYVFALDKQNVSLSADLKNAIDAIRSDPSEEVLGDFLEVWGTHFAYAGTFGAKGTAVNQYNKNQLKQMIDKQVNLEKAWSAGVSATVFGIGGGVKGGQSSKSATENYSNLESITGEGFNMSSCVGGLSCSPNGEPSPGAWVPVFLDLRPISELLGPPFYHDEATAVVLRDKLSQKITKYAFAANKQSDAVISTYEIGPMRISSSDTGTDTDKTLLTEPRNWYFLLSFPPDSSILERTDQPLNRCNPNNPNVICADTKGSTAITFFHQQKPANLEFLMDLRPNQGPPLDGPLMNCTVIGSGEESPLFSKPISIDKYGSETLTYTPKWLSMSRDCRGGPAKIEVDVTYGKADLDSWLGMSLN